MQTITTNLVTEAVFSDDGSKRYLLRKEWDKTKQCLAILMLAPSVASDIALDSTTLLVLNNAVRLGYGSVVILNLFASVNDNALSLAEDEDAENMAAIVAAVQEAHTIIYAPGVGKGQNKAFQQRQEQVLKALLPYENKLFCLCNAEGKARLLHPLAPAVRKWSLSVLRVKELVPGATLEKQEVKKRGNRQGTVAEAAGV